MTIWTPQLDGDKNLALTIVRALEADIECGKLQAGDRLPTQRELADVLGVALGTVTRAYSLAKEQGLVTGTIGRGTFVAGAAEEDGEIDLSRNMVFRDPKDAVVRAFLSNLGDAVQAASWLDREQDPAGVAEHRATAVDWMKRPGFAPSWEDTVICSGVQHGMHVILATATRPGDVVVTEAVTYAGIKAIAALHRLNLRGLPMDEHGLEAGAFHEACRRGAKVLYTTPTLQNPTTVTMPVERRQEIARIAERHGVLILEDDVYGFVDADAPLPIAAHAPSVTYYLMGTSKSLAPGLRVGYAVCPRGSAARIANTIRTTVWETSPLMSAVVMKWMQDGTAARIVAAKRAEVVLRQDIAASVLADFRPQVAAAPHWWIRLPEPWRADDLAIECGKQGVAITPASTFAIERENVPMAVRLCLAAVPSRERLRQGLTTFREILESGPKTYFGTT